LAHFLDVLVDQDSHFGVAQEPRQRSLAVEERKTAKILAIVLDQVEGIEDGRARGLPAAQLIEA
jgi:hypothetical protein